MRRSFRSDNRAAIALVGIALGCGAASANAQSVVQEVVVSLGTEVATNPYLDETDQSASIAATAEIRPRLSYDTSVTQFDLEAFARGSAFAENYGFQDNYGASARVRQRATEQLSLLLDAGVTSTDSPADMWWATGEGSVPGGPSIPLPPTEDVTVLGQRGRTTSIFGGVGIEYAATARDLFALSGDYRDVSLSHAGAEDYTVAEVEGRYSRVVDERTTLGLVTSYRRFNYDGDMRSDSESLAVLASFSLRLDRTWMLSGAAGIDRTRTDAGLTTPSSTNTSFSGNASLCRRDVRETFCVDYVRQSQPTGYSGLRNTDTIAASYSLQASEYDSVTLSGNYSRDSSVGSGPALSPDTKFAGVSGSYQHRFSQRLSGYVEASLDRLHRGGVALDPRARVGAGIRYSFGRIG